MVSWMKALLLSHILFFLGEKLALPETHLVPSMEVGQWFTMGILLIALNH